MDMATWWRGPWQRYVGAVALVALPTALALASAVRLDADASALILVLLVGSAARLWGSGPGLAAAMTSFAALGAISFPPAFELQPATPQQLLQTVLFTAVVISIALQVGRLREREEIAQAAQQEAATLSRLTAALVPDVPLDDVADDVVTSVAALTGAEWVELLLPDDHDGLAVVSQVAAEGASMDLVTGQIAEYVWRSGVAVGLPVADELQRGMTVWPESVDHNTATGTVVRRSDIALPLVDSYGDVLGVLYTGPRRRPIRYPASTVSRLVLVGRLMAVFLERHRLQEEAARAQATAEAEKLRASLVSSVSHELKTPLASINATVTGLLDEPEPNPDRTHAELEYILQDVARLNRSISDLLDLSRLQTDEWRPHKEWEDLADVVGSVVAGLPERDSSRVVLDLPEEPVTAEIDFVQVQRAVYHLVENALAYSPVDQRVVVTVRDSPQGAPTVIVADRGPGVPEAERGRIFEKFYRGSSSAAVPHGTGLGLAIATEIVNRHGGTLRVESARPSGSRFVLELPGTLLTSAGTRL